MLLKKNDYYATLQVHPKALDVVIIKAYRELCKVYHPDAGGSVEQMRRLNEAFEVLSSPDRRAAYDLQSGRLPWRRRAPATKAAPRRPEVGMPWHEPASPSACLRWVKGPLRPGVNYPFERAAWPWERATDRRTGRVVGCGGCQAEVLVVFTPERAGWERAIAQIDAMHCKACGHHAACYECGHTEARMAIEVRMQVVGRCIPLTTLWRAVK
jgi:hypothetical protein